MALTKSSTARAVVASASNSAGGTTNSSAQTVGYGVSGVAKITNGGTGPTVSCKAYLQFSADGTNWFGSMLVADGGTTASAVTERAYTVAPGGAFGDWTNYRVQFTGNTGQAVTVQADDSYTSAV